MNKGLKVTHKTEFKSFVLIESNIELEGAPSRMKLFATKYPHILICDHDVMKGNVSLIEKKQMILFSIEGGKLYSYFPVAMLNDRVLMEDAIDNFANKLKLE